MEKKQPFLQIGYTLTQLSVDIGSNTTYVSTAIRTHNKQNFHNFINSYRINYFKDYLRQHLDENLNIAILHQLAGFESQATFNRVFKQQEKMTPQNYREKLIRERALRQ